MENQPKRGDTVTNPKYNTAINQSHCPSTYLLSYPTATDLYYPDTYIHNPVVNNVYDNIGNDNSRNCTNTNTIVASASADVDNGGFRSLVDKEEAFLDSLPAGYRFRPYDAELVGCYLKGKINNETLPPNRIREVELYKHNPDYLAANYKSGGENEWYFFTPRDRKYPNGDRPSRAAGDGYWKATGADKPVKIGGVTVGFRRALVFYKGKPAKGHKTNWIMHEYRANEPHNKKRGGENNMKLDDWVLCRIYKKFDRAFNAPTLPRAGGLPSSKDDEHEQETISMPVAGSYEQEIYPYLDANLVTSHHFNELAQPFDEHFRYGNPSFGPVLGPNLPFQGYPKPSNEYFNVPPLQDMDTSGDFSRSDQNYDDHMLSSIAPYQHMNGSNDHMFPSIAPDPHKNDSNDHMFPSIAPDPHKNDSNDHMFPNIAPDQHENGSNCD